MPPISKVYNVNLIEKDKLVISGKGKDALWHKAITLDDFNCFWNDEIESRMIFKALWDGDFLFFCFKVYDTSLHIDTSNNTINEIGNSDRVTLF